MEQSEFFSFIDLLHQFANIRRTVKLKGHDDFENDAEHSYILAMTAWYLMDRYELVLDREKVFSYALCHDLVEVYAGDTDPHIHTEDHINSKAAREHEALGKIADNFPCLSRMRDTIIAYEKLEDQESKFVYMVDKILPITNIFVTKDSYGMRYKLTFERWEKVFEEKKKKADFQNQEIVNFLEEFKLFLKKSSGLFYKE